MATATSQRIARRIVGVDLARGLAVLGMYGAHVGVTQPFDWLRPGTWLDVVNGRSSILFAVLAGVSIAIISGGRKAADRTALRQARIRITARALLIFVLGAYLASLETGIAIILPVYAVLFAASLPFLRWPPGWVLVFAAAVAVVVPAIVTSVAAGSRAKDLLSELFVTGSYPAFIWIVFVLVGLGIGRLDLGSTRVGVRILLAGIAAAVIGYGGGAFALAAVTSSRAAVPRELRALATTEPHSGSPFEVIGSTGFALAVIGLCLLLPRVLQVALSPLAAVGAMALSAYTVHVLIVEAIGRGAFDQPDNALYLRFIVGALVACWLWARLLGRGPLERILTALSRVAAAPPRR